MNQSKTDDDNYTPSPSSALECSSLPSPGQDVPVAAAGVTRTLPQALLNPGQAPQTAPQPVPRLEPGQDQDQEQDQDQRQEREQERAQEQRQEQRPEREREPTQHHPYPDSGAHVLSRQTAPAQLVSGGAQQTPISAGKKRSSSGLDQYPPPTQHTPSSEPLRKKQRLHPRARHTLDRFTFPTFPTFPSFPQPGQPGSLPHNRGDPPSPLFFSNSLRYRPMLPPRFSSSEAAASMLSKAAKSEDSHVKTVTLARGTVSTPSFPTSAPRRSIDRSSGPRSASPDPFIRGDITPSALNAIGIVELLEQDERPCMIIDLADHSNYGPGPLHPLYANNSIRAYQSFFDAACGRAGRNSPGTSHGTTFVQFKAWLLSAAVQGESLNVCLPSFTFLDMRWTVATLRRRLRVVSGAMLEPAQKSASSASPFNNSSVASTGRAHGYEASPASHSATSAQSLLLAPPEEPHDYFGDALPPASSTQNGAGSDHGVVLPSTEDSGKESADRASMLRKVLSLSSSDPATLASHPSLAHENMLNARTAGNVDWFDSAANGYLEGPSFDWTRLPVTDAMPQHVQFARSIDWGATALGPIDTWSADLRQMCNLIMASPHPAAMYWGEDLVAIYNEAYVLLAGQKHPELMGQSYRVAWSEIWPEVEGVFESAINTGEATMKDDDRLFILRNGYLEETYFSWSIIPMVGGDGSVMGLYNPAFEKTRRKLAERRMLTLREIGERTASARDVKGFWSQVLGALELNEYDAPFVLLYSVGDELDSDASSMHSNSVLQSKQCVLEGTLGVPEGHHCAPASIDLKTGLDGFGPVFREVMKTDKPVLLEVGSHDLPVELLEGLGRRGFSDACRGVVVCPVHPTTGEANLGYLIMGVNPRRPYDEDYSLFVQLLSRQLATSLASVVLFEEEIRRGQRAAKLAALDRMELSHQLATKTQEAIESETKFTRMAEFAPVGMFIANPEGRITYCNNTWFDISHVSRDENTPDIHWMDAVKDEDRPLLNDLWHNLIIKKEAQTASFRFKTPWQNAETVSGDRWVLFSAYPERYENGALKSVFGSLTDISKQKWAEDFQKRKMEEAVELKTALEKFIDITSHEMRNPLSAILQCADDIVRTMSEPDKLAKSLEDSSSSIMDSAQTITLCAQHQKRIVDDILTLSKLDSQLLLVTPVDAQPLTVAQRALKMHEGEVHTADIQLKFAVDESYKALGVDWVRLDPSRVLQVLINLTTNAIKFTTMEKKRTITVTMSASLQRYSELPNPVVNYFPTRKKNVDLFEDKEWGTGEEVYIHFAVQDTGRGLNEEEKKMLFLRFSQASPRTHVQYGGSGLGLFISRELTELQGGEIGVASEAGVGSTFAFYIKARRTPAPAGPDTGIEHLRHDSDAHGSKPVLSATTVSGKAKQTEKTESDGPPRRVLIVEDNLVNQRVMAKQLRNLGCTVHVANHGGEALDILRKSNFWDHAAAPETKAEDRIVLSCVLMDQEMPVMNGLTCTKKIRELEAEGKFIRHIPIIAVTANARAEQIQTALSFGMDDVMPKPFRIPDLLPKIDELMAQYPEP